MRITYELTADEFIAAQSLHSRRNPIGYVTLAICYFIALLLGVFLMLSVVSFPKVGFTLSSVSQEFFPLLIVLIPLWMHLYWRYRFKSSRVSNSPCVLDFGEDRIVTEMPGFSKSTVEWVAIKRYRESKKMLLVYISGVSFFAIPRRACEQAEYIDLIALLKRKLPSGLPVRTKPQAPRSLLYWLTSSVLAGIGCESQEVRHCDSSSQNDARRARAS